VTDFIQLVIPSYRLAPLWIPPWKASIELERVDENALFLKASQEMGSKIQIFDLSGKLAFEELKRITMGRNEIKMDQLTPTNIYVLHVVDKKTSSFQTIKFKKKNGLSIK